MELIKSYCSQCLRNNNHHIVFKANRSEEYHDWFEEEDFLIIKCAGCDKMSFRTEYWDNNCYDEDGVDKFINTYPVVLKNKKALQDTYLLPHAVGLLYSESIKALANKCHVLASAGFRAIIEAVCIDKGISKEDDAIDKIELLLKNNFLTEADTNRLHAIRISANASIHTGEVPTEKELYNALIVIEHLLSTLYLLDKTVSIHLKGMITTYVLFKGLLDEQLCNFEIEEERTLKRLLGEVNSRILPKYHTGFETKLIDDITNAKYSKLVLGKKVIQKNNKGVDVEVQYYKVLNNEKVDPMAKVYRDFHPEE